MPDAPRPSAPAAPATCARCGVPVRVQPPRRSNASMLKRAHVPKGVCANCAVTEFLKNSYPCNMLLQESPHGAHVLLMPQIQQQFVAIMESGNADMRPEEIDWETVVRQWDLPVKVQRTATNPWLPTDEPWRPPSREAHAADSAEAEAALRLHQEDADDGPPNGGAS